MWSTKKLTVLAYCVAANCNNSQTTPGITMHKFPHNQPAVRQKWIKFIQFKWADFLASPHHAHLCSEHFSKCDFANPMEYGTGITQWLERRTRDWKVAGLNPCRSGGRIFLSRVNYLCWLLFRYPFYPHVTAVARERYRSFCQKYRLQLQYACAYTLCMWLCMKWHGAWLYGVHKTCAETAAVSCGTSDASRCKYTTLVDIQKRTMKS